MVYLKTLRHSRSTAHSHTFVPIYATRKAYKDGGNVTSNKWRFGKYYASAAGMVYCLNVYLETGLMPATSEASAT